MMTLSNCIDSKISKYIIEAIPLTTICQYLNWFSRVLQKFSVNIYLHYTSRVV